MTALVAGPTDGSSVRIRRGAGLKAIPPSCGNAGVQVRNVLFCSAFAANSVAHSPQRLLPAAAWHRQSLQLQCPAAQLLHRPFAGFAIPLFG